MEVEGPLELAAPPGDCEVLVGGGSIRSSLRSRRARFDVCSSAGSAVRFCGVDVFADELGTVEVAGVLRSTSMRRSVRVCP